MSLLEDYARKLCRYLNDRDEVELTELDLIDALVSAGLTLLEDQTGEAAISYHRLGKTTGARQPT